MRRALPLFLAADAASLFGNSAIAIALPWLVLERTGDAAAAGTVAALSALPALLAAAVGGVLIDRFGRRRMSVLSDLMSALAVAALPVVDAVAGLSFGWFVVLGVLGALADSPGVTARESLMPDVARAAGIRLDRLSAIRESFAGVAFLLGPALGGLLLALLPTIGVIWLTAGTSALAALLTLLIPAAVGRRTATVEHEGAGGWLRSLREGARVLADQPVLAALTVLGTGSVLVVAPLQGLVLPTYYLARDEPGLLGATLSALALGMIGGSAISGALAGRVRRRVMYLLCIAVVTVGLLAVAVLPPPPVMIAAMVVVGVGSGLLSPLLPVLVAERAPESARGRILGLQNAAALAALPLGMAVVGWIAGGASLQVAAIVLAAVWLVVAVYGVSVRGMRAIDQPGEA